MVEFRELVETCKKNGKKFVCTLPVLHAGNAKNVIAEKCIIEGTLRSLDSKFTGEFKIKIENLANKISEKYKGQVEICFSGECPPVINTPKETEHVKRVARRVFGEDMVTNVGLPEMGSEDFSFFLDKAPGCYFYVNSFQGEKPVSVHSNNFDFDDNSIEKWSEMWLRLIEDRFNLKFD